MLYKGVALTSDSALKFKIWTRKVTHFPTRYVHISVGIYSLVQVPVEATRGHQIFFPRAGVTASQQGRNCTWVSQRTEGL